MNQIGSMAQTGVDLNPRRHGAADSRVPRNAATTEECFTGMSTFGYRLFTVELRKGFGRKPVDFATCDDSHYIDLVPKLLSRLAGTKIGRPILRNSTTTIEQATIDDPDAVEPEGISGESAFRVEDPLRNQWAFTGSIQAGNFGDHEIALGVPGETEDADLLNRAPVRRFRFVMVLPESGSTGILAIETIGRACPVDLFTRWLSKASLDESLDNKGLDPDSADPNWWKMVANQMGDEEHLNSLIQSGRFGKVELVKHEITPDRKRNKEHLRLTAPSIEGGLVSEVAGVVKNWWARSRQLADTNGESHVPPATDAEGAQQLAALVAKGVSGLDFDDGWVVLEEQGGRTNRISPSRMSEVFIYPLSQDDRVSDVEFYRRTRDRATRIGPSIQVIVEWPEIQGLQGLT